MLLVSIYTDIPVRSKKDSIDNLNKFYTFNKPFELDYKKVDDVYGFTYANYYIIIIGNNNVDKDELNKWINSIDKFTIVFTERKDITAGNAIYNHIDEKEYKVITSTYKESVFDVEDDIYEKTISIENYFTDNVFNENLIWYIMAVVKIYDKVQNKWVAVGTNEAIGVMTSNPELLKSGQSETNVEEHRYHQGGYQDRW